MTPKLPLLSLLAILLACTNAVALDLTGGMMVAVPVPGGKAPVVDGDLSDWDLSGAEPVWISAQTAPQMHALFALMYDDQALYFGAKVSLPNRPIHNTANPVDAFWGGDLLQFRVAADPTLPRPLNTSVSSNRVAHISLWKNSDTGRDYLHIGYGVNLEGGSTVNPPGSSVVITPHDSSYYVIEARIPWEALHAPGGLNPFRAGGRMTAVLDMLWVGGDTARTAAIYRTNPGDFAFNQPGSWGQVEFSPTGNLKPRHESMEGTLARLAGSLQGPAQVGVPITINVPEPMKVSVNILGPHGEVIRELMGGQRQPKGPVVVRWDGKDQWGAPMPPGRYRWGAYLSYGLQARFMGGVGKSGHPYYDTPDGKGGWGADHSNPIDVAADATGMYFLWPVAESGRAVVKTDYTGQVLWRKTPFVGGGFGPFFAIAANGRNVFITFGDSKPQLVRLDARTGQTLTFGSTPGATSLTPISDSAAIGVPAGTSPLGDQPASFGATVGSQPESVGLACTKREVFASVYSQNLIQVMEPKMGLAIRQLPCPGPHGLALDDKGNLYAVSYAPGQPPQVIVFSDARGTGRPVISTGLEAPWDVAVDAQGLIHVSDGGSSQQIKTFSPEGKRLRTLGKKGGRPRAGTYDPKSFRNPAGIAADAQGGILVAEASIPKVMSRWDARTGKALGRWFGAPAYWSGTFPDPDNPWTVYYQLPGGLARATIPAPGANGYPSASWDLPAAGMDEVGDMTSVIPEVLTAANRRKYLVEDGPPHGICLVQGDQMLPIAHFRVFNRNDKGNKLGKNYLEVWIDRNGDHRMQPEEVTNIDTVVGGPLVEMADWFSTSMRMTPKGDLYLMTAANRILEIPAAGFSPDGSIRWNLDKISYPVPVILPSLGSYMYAGPRGQAGLRVDKAGNIYTCFSANVPYVTPDLLAKMKAQFPDLPQSRWGAYATKELADRMHEGLGHTAESNAVKFARFAPDGHLLWMAGRKATAAAAPGEMYHFWSLAGLIGDNYIAGASEWGPIYLYTRDGFFVDSLMNNPGLNPPPGPYTFGSETGGARVQYFPKLDQVWAYSVGMAYRVDGFLHGLAAGERRIYGEVNLDKVYDTEVVSHAAEPLRIAPLTGEPMLNAGPWTGVPTSTLQRNGAPLADAQLGYDAAYLYGRIHVNDPTPLQNSADTLNLAFKGGDTAGIVLGPGGVRNGPVLGDIRIMVAWIAGHGHLIAMKPVTGLPNRPEEYTTPSSGHVRFDYLGDVPGGRLRLTLDPDGKGYTALFAVPRSFLELSLTPGAVLAGDVEVRLSGPGPRGLQATSRNYLFTPLRSETTMTDDIPTEARLYPQWWGSVTVN